MKVATPLENALVVRDALTLPDGVGVVMIDCYDYVEYKRTPSGIVYDGKVYGRTGWNSDKHVVYYRTDAKPAFGLDR
tara:strand:+ start:448 stop:678 length:231 start_codon:yes stop_codon:yes gene_type:complete